MNLSQAAGLLAELTDNPYVKDDAVRIIMLGAEGEIPISWRNSLHIWTRISSQVELLPRDKLEPLPDTDASPNWLQVNHFALCGLEFEQQTECWTFEIDNEDVLNLMHRGELFLTDLGLGKWVRHQVDYENVTIDRSQLYIVEQHLRKYAGTLLSEKVRDIPAQAPAMVKQVQISQADLGVVSWTLKKPPHFKKYNEAVYKYLKAAFDEKAPNRPTASEMIDAWRRAPVAPIIGVEDGIARYENSRGVSVDIGKTPIENLENIRKSIGRMTTKNKP